MRRLFNFLGFSLMVTLGWVSVDFVAFHTIIIPKLPILGFMLFGAAGWELMRPKDRCEFDN